MNCYQTDTFIILKKSTSNGTQFFIFKILHESNFTLRVCMGIEIAKPQLDLNFDGE